MNTGNFNRIETVRVWCQKVLPLVYDDSLSYMELLSKVLGVLNTVIENVDVLADSIEKIDINTRVDEKFTELVDSGYFENIINQMLPQILPTINERIDELDRKLNDITNVVNDLSLHLNNAEREILKTTIRVKNLEDKTANYDDVLATLTEIVNTHGEEISNHEERIAALEEGGGGDPYVLPTATRTRLGGVKVGEGLEISASGVLKTTGGGGEPYELPTATANRLGGIKVGRNLSVESDGTLNATGGGGGGESYTHYDSTTRTLYFTERRQ